MKKIPRKKLEIFYNVDSFEIKTVKDLHEKCKSIKWSRYFSEKQTFKVLAHFSNQKEIERKSPFKNSLYAAQVVKDGIADSFRDDGLGRPNVELEFPQIQVSLHLTLGAQGTLKASLSFDLCLDPLSNRNHRTKYALAPMRENLAASLVMEMFPLEKKEEWKNQTVIDSMSGGGNFILEFLMMKYDVPPSWPKLKALIEQKRNQFALFNVTTFRTKENLAVWKKITEDLYGQTRKNLPRTLDENVRAYDLDMRAIKSIRESLEGFFGATIIRVERADATKIKKMHEEETGVIFCNPPYGVRLGDEEELEKLYEEYGENLKNNFKNFTAYIFTQHAQLRKKISLRTSSRKAFYNGPLECRLLEYRLF